MACAGVGGEGGRGAGVIIACHDNGLTVTKKAAAGLDNAMTNIKCCRDGLVRGQRGKEGLQP